MLQNWRKYKFSMYICASKINNQKQMTTEKNTNNIKVEQVKQWLLAHPLIKIRALNKAAELPENTIKNSMINERRPFPAKYLNKVIAILKSYGYTE